MKWILTTVILITTISYGQTTDTLTNARSYYNSIEYQQFSGVDSLGHIYGIAFSKQYLGVNTWGNIIGYKIDYTTHHITSHTLPNSATSQGIMWRDVMDSSGIVYSSQATGVRQVWKFNFKGEDTIYTGNLGNTSTNNDGLTYTTSLGRDGGMYFGNSSGVQSTDGAWQNKNASSITKFTELDALNGYVTTIGGDTNWIYAQTGQNDYKIFSINKQTLVKHEIMRRNDGFPYNMGVYRDAVYVGVGSGPTWKLVNGDTVRVAGFPAANLRIEYSETNGTAQPVVSNFFDPSTSKYYYAVNGVTDHVQMPSNYYPNTIRRNYVDLINTNKINYIGEAYGYYTDYFISQDSAVTIGFAGINIYCGKQLDAHRWLYVGYPSSNTIIYDDRLEWTAETFANAAYRPLSTTTNPKSMGTGRATSDVHEPQKLITLDNGLICFGGNEIRTGNTVGFNWFDTATNILNGMNGDHFSPRQFSDMATWGNKMILSTQTTTTGGKLFMFDGITKTLVDSIDVGFKNAGYICAVGDRLYGIAQDTANVFQTIDSTIFYIYNLSTKQRVYYRKMVGNITNMQIMPDGYIGVVFTTRVNPGAPLSNATLPTDFFALRRIDNLTYTFNGVNKYYAPTGYNVRRYSGLTNQANIIDVNTYQGKYQTLINWLH